MLSLDTYFNDVDILKCCFGYYVAYSLLIYITIVYYRYIAAAQALIAHSRGKLRADRRDIWVLKDYDEYASHDDITCFVVPLMENPIESTPQISEESEPGQVAYQDIGAESEVNINNASAEKNKSGQQAAFSGSVPSLSGSCSSFDFESSCEKTEDEDNQKEVLSEDEPCVNSNNADYAKESDSLSPVQENSLTDETKTLS